MTAKNLDFEVDRNDFTKTRVVTQDELPTLTAGQVRFRIDRFALTANNVTYALTGDQLDYWRFFPADEPWGRIPAMGWADVVESDHPDVAVGGRYYGWYPMSRYLTIDARPTAGGLVDEGAGAPQKCRWCRSTRGLDRQCVDQGSCAGLSSRPGHRDLGRACTHRARPRRGSAGAIFPPKHPEEI